jgi:hypothetical protein
MKIKKIITIPKQKIKIISIMILKMSPISNKEILKISPNRIKIIPKIIKIIIATTSII